MHARMMLVGDDDESTEVPHPSTICLVDMGQAQYLYHRLSGEVSRVFPRASGDAGAPYKLVFDPGSGNAAIASTGEKKVKWVNEVGVVGALRPARGRACA